MPRGDLDALEAALGPDVAALIVEPIQGLAGAVDLGAGYLAAARELTSRAGALLIFDEVQCGMGRTGHPFAAQAYGVTPDLLTTAKGIAGGFPAGAVLASDAVAAGLGKGDLGSTFGGGPLACALIEAVIDTIESEGLLARVRSLSHLIRDDLPGGAGRVDPGGGLPARPAHLAAGAGDRRRAAGEGDPGRHRAAIRNIVRLLPPLILEESHVATLAAALAEIRP